MKKLMWHILAALFTLSFAVVTPAAARPAPTSCSGVLANMVISGDLVVPDREHCELNNVSVRGDVRLRNGAGFTPYDSRIAGSITGTQFELLHVLNTHIAGAIRLHDGVRVEIDAAKIGGGILLNDTLDARVVNSQVRGNLVIRAAVEQAQLCGSTVGGDARFAHNRGLVAVGGDAASCAANAVRGNLRVHHNQEQVIIANNTIGRNLVCAANTSAPALSANEVGGKARGQCGAGEPVSPDELGDE